MAARFPQSGTSIGFRLKPEWASKILVLYWAAGADSLHRLRSGETSTTVITRATSGATFNSTEGRIEGDSSVSFADSIAGGYGGLLESSDFTLGASYYGDLFNGITAHAGIITAHGSQIGLGPYIPFTKLAGGSNLDIGGTADDVQDWLVIALRTKQSDLTNKQRTWINGAEGGTAGNGSTVASDGIGATATPLSIGATKTGIGNTKTAFEAAFLGTADLTDADLAAITANPSILIEVAVGANELPTFPGPNIADISATQNIAITPDTVSDSFIDTDALTFSAVGSWPAGIVVTSAGVIQGTPTATGTFTALKVRAMDTASQTVDSNTFQIVVTAPGDAVLPTQAGSITASSITQTGFTISWPAGADNVGIAGYEYSLNNGANWTNAGDVLTVTLTGLTPSTAYPVQVRAYDAAGNRSTPALAATVTTAAASGDSTVPTHTGTITVSNVTSSGFKLAWPAASDNVGVFGYEVSIDGGSNYTNVGSVLTITETGRPVSTAHQIRVRAYDAANNRSAPLSATATTTAATSGTITTDPFSLNNGGLRTGLTGLIVAVLDLATLAYVKNFTGRTTDVSTGRMTISAPEMVAGSWYAVVTTDTNGVLGVEKYQAA